MDIKKLTTAARREIALYHLRVNPKKRNKIEGSLKRGETDRCALGLIAEAFDIPCTTNEIRAKGHDPLAYNAYVEIAKILGLPYCEVSTIYMWNDNGRTTFADVADRMEKAFQDQWKLDEQSV